MFEENGTTGSEKKERTDQDLFLFCNAYVMPLVLSFLKATL